MNAIFLFQRLKVSKVLIWNFLITRVLMKGKSLIRESLKDSARFLDSHVEFLLKMLELIGHLVNGDIRAILKFVLFRDIIDFRDLIFRRSVQLFSVKLLTALMT